MKQAFKGFVRYLVPWIFIATSVLFQSGCANRPDIVHHQFTFNAVRDSPGITILDYQYGTSQQPGARPPEYERRSGHVNQGTGISGDMVRGDFLYVKWQIQSTGEILEDTVDLKHLEPRDIENCNIYFVVKARQLQVYLITPEKAPPDWPQYKPPGYTHLKTYLIYPPQ